MKKLVSFIAILLCAAMMLPLATASVFRSDAASGDAYYVATNGKEGADGSQNDPFASVADAQKALRARIAAGNLPDGGITVYIRGGEYSLGSIEFTKEDSGTEKCPITWCAYENETPVFNGGFYIDPSDFTPAPADIKSKLIEQDNASKLLQLDISGLGLSSSSQLFIADKRATIARWPDNSFIGHFLGDGGGNTIHDDTGRIAMWSSWNGAIVAGYPNTDYFREEGLITAFNADETFTATVNFGGFAHFYFYNVLDEISMPGEYYVDTANGKLYLIPPEGFDSEKILVTSGGGNGTAVVCADGMEYVTFRGLEFKGYRCNVFDIKNAKTVTVDSCTVRNCDSKAIDINGFDCKVINNTIYNLGGAGITVGGGDQAKLIPANNLVDNNLIHDFSQLGGTYAGGVNIASSFDIGITVSHNEIYNTKHLAISGGCSDCIVEYNLIHDVCLEANDAGAVYTGRFEAQDQIYRYNIIYNSYNKYGFGSPNGIYVDDGGSYKIAYGNFFYNIGGNAFAMGGGSNNQIYNNIMIKCGTGVNYDSRQMANNWEADMSAYPDGLMWKLMLAHEGYKTRNFVMRYPRITLVNISNRRSDTDRWSLGNFGLTTIRGNVYINCERGVNLEGMVASLAVIRDNAAYNNSDLSFIPGLKSYDFTISENAPFYNDIVGFKTIPVEEIGRRK